MIVKRTEGRGRVQIFIRVSGEGNTAVSVAVGFAIFLFSRTTGTCPIQIVAGTGGVGAGVPGGIAFAQQHRPGIEFINLKTCDKDVTVIAGILNSSQNNLFQIVGAGDGTCFGTSFIQSR